jgi:glycosyltransferase involved in cell wall biosynthesis
MSLAVLVPVLGTGSETFIRRHVWGLDPDAVVITRRRAPAGTGAWDAPGPVLELDTLEDEWCGLREQAAVTQLHSDHRVTAVLAEFLDVWVHLLPAILEPGRTVWAHAHGYDVSSRLADPWWRAEYRRWSAATGIVTMSALSAGRLSELGLASVRVVPYGVDVPASGSPRPPGQGCLVVAVGRMVPKKAPLVTVRAFGRAAGQRPQLELVIAGGGPLLAAVQATAGPRVTTPGALSPQDVGNLLARADVFAQHSVVDPETGDEEGLPVAILEAMAAGLPVVATRHAGIPEAVVDGVTGLLVDEGDERGMAEAIGLLADRPELRREMGMAGWQRARDLFTWERERESLRGLLWPDVAL